MNALEHINQLVYQKYQTFRMCTFCSGLDVRLPCVLDKATGQYRIYSYQKF